MAYTTIDKPSDYFNTSLWSGDGNAQTISGVGFQPDFLWAKNRSDSYSNILTDSVRGITKQLKSEGNASELTNAQGVTAFNADGYVLGTQADFAVNSNTFVGWAWRAGGSASSNSDGSITTTVSVNQTAGFSIVTWTASANATIGHGLGVKPAMVIAKSRTTATNWPTWHQKFTGTPEDVGINLNGTSALASFDTDYWGTGGFTSTVFGVKNAGYHNNSGDMVAYCFAEKKGYSKFGSYTGNGSADGTFIYTGFKPAFILSKKTDSAGTNWTIWDNKRSSSNYNPTNKILHPNVSNAENTADDTDFLSNGFKLRATASGMNASGGTYIYAAFAEEPLVANVGQSIPATAR